MHEISLNILDAVNNSLSAGATHIALTCVLENDRLTVVLTDNGFGMTEEQAAQCIDPFYTTRTSRNIGLGLPLFKMNAENSGGSFQIRSRPNIGTELKAEFHTDHIDCVPMGDLNEVMSLLAAYTECDYFFTVKTKDASFYLDTASFLEEKRLKECSHSEAAALLKQYIAENSPKIDKIIPKGNDLNMKSLEELNALRDQMKKKMGIRHDSDAEIKVVVAMGTCGIAAGARDVLSAFACELEKNELCKVALTQSGCEGNCDLEPIVDVYGKDGNKVTYVKMNAEKAAKVVAEHLVKGNIVTEYTLGAKN